MCIMRMEEGLDTGAYCVCRKADVANKSAGELTDELADLGSHALLTALVHVERGAADWKEQDETQATYASKIEKGELDLHPGDGAAVLVRKVRASSEAHPARAVVAGRAVTVRTLSEPGDEEGRRVAAGMEPGEVRFAARRLLLGASDGAVEVLSLKPDGKQEMDAKAFAAGIQGIKTGSTWEGLHG